ncbi:MAG: DUF4159 domain-containing protein [Leptolyngbya sp. SIO1D8]|nr:DUF4159 domain-containing protein [Leptolyngbya sp. SIO1D8]
MVRSPFPMPELVPLTRLHVQDSLRVNAERWSLAHDYHRKRQNIHYQSLWQPGIVCGLGVKLIAPPEVAHGQFKEAYWIEIQPGLAIDGEGNPIVVEPEPAANRAYPLMISTPLESERTLYVVVRYVDPDDLDVSPKTDRILERFRFDQRIDVLEPSDIELFRIQLSRGDIQITTPQNPFYPEKNQIDLRYRLQAQLRSSNWLNIGLLSPLPQHKIQSFQTLMKAIPALYGQMQVSLNDTPITRLPDRSQPMPHLIYSQSSALTLTDSPQQLSKLSGLREYLNRNGCLWVETPELNPALLRSLQFLKRELDLQPVPEDHVLRQQPFWFNSWPQPLGQSIEVLCDRGLIVIVGELVDRWQGAGLSRTAIREMQEWGLNLLHYVWQRHHFQKLLN